MKVKIGVDLDNEAANQLRMIETETFINQIVELFTDTARVWWRCPLLIR